MIAQSCARVLLDVQNLTTRFHTRNGTVYAVEDVSFSLEAGQTVGIVGESGSGKSVTSLAVMGLIPDPPGRTERGEVLFRGRGCRVGRCRPAWAG